MPSSPSCCSSHFPRSFIQILLDAKMERERNASKQKAFLFNAPFKHCDAHLSTLVASTTMKRGTLNGCDVTAYERARASECCLCHFYVPCRNTIKEGTNPSNVSSILRRSYSKKVLKRKPGKDGRIWLL